MNKFKTLIMLIVVVALLFAYNKLDANAVTPPVGNGLSAQYYSTSDFTGNAINRIDSNINFNWNQKAPDVSYKLDSFSAKWNGQISVPRSGYWKIYSLSDDGVRVYINGKLIISDWKIHPPKENSARIYLAKGKSYKINIEYYNKYVGATMKLYWSIKGVPKQIIPQSALKPGTIIQPPTPTTTTTKVTPTTKPITSTTKVPPTPTTAVPTTKPATTTTKVVTPTSLASTTTKATTPTTDCNFNNSVGTVSHPINISVSGTQQIWVRVSHNAQATLQISFNNAGCISETFNSMGTDFMWMPVNSAKPNISAGSKTLTIGSSLTGLKLSTVLVFDSRIICTPSGDGSNCSNQVYVAPTTPTSPTTIKPTNPPTTQVTTTTMMDHGNMGGSAADNLALEQFRNVDSRYTKNANTSSDQLPLATLTRKTSPSSSVFMSQPLGERFRTSCDFSHLAYDDPIIKPNQPGKSHLHMFFGNTGTNANSTPDSILNSGGSTCSGFEANRTAYWFPTVHDAQGRVRIPNGMVMYYKTEGVAKPAAGYTDIPQGLKIIAGNAGATAPQASAYNNGWGCRNMFINPNQTTIPSCDSSTGMMMKLHFPRCWDGSFDFDPTKPQAHVMYEINGQCPSTHSKVFTGMTALFDWDLAPGETTAG